MSDTQYTAIAGFYDELNAGTDYVGYARFLDGCFSRYAKKHPSLVLDAACGTGSMLIELARLGYDMIGSDLSEDMLAVAMRRTAEEGLHPLLLCQDMRSLDLYGTVEAAVCCLDSINYLTGDGDLAACFRSIGCFLEPDGLFVFDVNTPYKFRHVYGTNDIVTESETALCAWSNYFDEESRICEFVLSFFREEEDGRYRRYDEVQHERCYERSELESALTAAGFEILTVVSDFDFSEPDEDSERWHFVCRIKK